MWLESVLGRWFLSALYAGEVAQRSSPVLADLFETPQGCYLCQDLNLQISVQEMS